MPTFSSLSKQNWPREWVPGELDHFYGDPRGAGGRADPRVVTAKSDDHRATVGHED
jgi:hypothetical protein